MGKTKLGNKQQAVHKAPKVTKVLEVPKHAAAPMPVQKIPSLRGKHYIGLHAGGGMAKAPSPRLLPRPPTRWTTAVPQPVPLVRRESSLRNEEQVQKQLQGNMLYTLISPEQPALAGKITGMLLDAYEPRELGALIASESERREAIREALAVLSEAGDPRVAAVGGPAAGALSVDVQLASSCAAPSAIRMSPRDSLNPYASANILKLAAPADQAVMMSP